MNILRALEAPCQSRMRGRPKKWSRPRQSHRQGECHAAPAHAGSILELQRSFVRLGNLTAEHQANPGSAGFGGEERNEEVGRIRETWPLVFNDDLELRTGPPNRS